MEHLLANALLGGIAVFIGTIVAKVFWYYWTSPILKDFRRPRPPYETDLAKKKAMLRQEFSLEKVPSNVDVVVIGSGIGGLSTASMLAKAGKKVLVLEQHEIAGGAMAPVAGVPDGYVFDYGVHYIGEVAKKGPAKFYMDQLTEGQIEWAPLDPVYDQVVIGLREGDTQKWFPVIQDGPKNWKPLLKKRFPAEHKAIDQYFDMMSELRLYGWGVIFMKTLPLWLVKVVIRTGLIKLLVPAYRDKYVTQSTYDIVSGLTQNPDLRTLFCHLYLVLCCSTKELTFPIMAGCFFHYNSQGECFPKGGVMELARVLVSSIERRGGRVLVKANVTEILFENNKTAGVRVTGPGDVGTHDIRVKTVVSNAGLHNTFRRLVPREIAAQSSLYGVQQVVKPCQAQVVCFVGFNRSNEELGLRKETVWAFADNDAGLTSDRYISGTLEDALNVDIPELAVSFSSVKDPNWNNMPDCRDKATCTMGFGCNYEWFKKFEHLPPGNRGAEYRAVKENFTKKVLDAFCRLYPHLREHISCVKVSTPVSSSHFVRTYKGGIYGTEFGRGQYNDPLQVAKLRPYTGIEGLYLSGQDITTAGVVPTATSGMLAASAVLGRKLVFDLNAVDMYTTAKEWLTGKRFGEERPSGVDENRNAGNAKEFQSAGRSTAPGLRRR